MAREAIMNVSLDEIAIGDRREVNEEAVKKLAKSIKEIGLQHPITVRSVDGVFHLVAGRHRLEAHRLLGEDLVPAAIVRMDELDAEMWEISENLHRAELTVLERDQNVTRWIELKELKRVSSQSEKKPGRPESGVNAASRELGIDKNDAYRAVKVAGLSDEAKAAAVELGLDDNRSALLEAAKQPEDKQADALRARVIDVQDAAAARRNKIDADVKSRAAREVAEMLAEHVPGEWWDALKANLYAAGAANIAHELTNITGQSIMDRNFA